MKDDGLVDFVATIWMIYIIGFANRRRKTNSVSLFFNSLLSFFIFSNHFSFNFILNWPILLRSSKENQTMDLRFKQIASVSLQAKN